MIRCICSAQSKNRYDSGIVLAQSRNPTLSADSGIVPDNSRIAQGIYIGLSSDITCAQSKNRVGQSRNLRQCKVRIIGQSKNNRGMSTNIYRNRKRDNAEKRNISKIKIAVEIDQENNNKDFWTIILLQRTEEILFYICI